MGIVIIFGFWISGYGIYIFFRFCAEVFGFFCVCEGNRGFFVEFSFVFFDVIRESIDGVEGEDDRVYFFFTEVFVEYEFIFKLMIFRVARVCKVSRFFRFFGFGGGDSTFGGSVISFRFRVFWKC